MQGVNRIKEAAHLGKQEGCFRPLRRRLQALDIPLKIHVLAAAPESGVADTLPYPGAALGAELIEPAQQ